MKHQISLNGKYYLANLVVTSCGSQTRYYFTTTKQLDPNELQPSYKDRELSVIVKYGVFIIDQLPTKGHPRVFINDNEMEHAYNNRFSGC